MAARCAPPNDWGPDGIGIRTTTNEGGDGTPPLRCMRQSSRSGFTLLEFLLAVAIGVTMVGAIVESTMLVFAARVEQQAIAEVEQQGTLALQRILQMVRNAEAITSPAVGVSAPVLVLDVVPTVDDPMTFDLASGVLRITRGAGATIALTNSRVTASALTVDNRAYVGTRGTVRVSFVLDHQNPSGREEYAYQQTFSGSASLR